jgi:hypothetical protein
LYRQHRRNNGTDNKQKKSLKNKAMLHHITWHQYLTGIVLAAVIYYIVIILRCYRPELQRVSKQLNCNNENGYLPEALRYQPDADKPAENLVQADSFSEYPEHQQEPVTEYDHLAAELKASIAKAADKPFAPAILLQQLKKIVRAQPAASGRADRQAINELIVNECEKTGTALLTADEVDQWWSD